MAFLKKTITITITFRYIHGEGRSNISRGVKFSQVEGVLLHISI